MSTYMQQKKEGIEMSKRKQANDRSLNLADTLDEDMLAQLKAAKKELTKVEQKEEKERQKQLRLEREEREKNKSFEELLEEYGDIGSKY